MCKTILNILFLIRWTSIKSAHIESVSRSPVATSQRTARCLHSYYLLFIYCFGNEHHRNDFIYRICLSAVGQFVKVEKKINEANEVKWKKNEKYKHGERGKERLKIQIGARSLYSFHWLQREREICVWKWYRRRQRRQQRRTQRTFTSDQRRRQRRRECAPARVQNISRKSVASHKLWHYKSARRFI